MARARSKTEAPRPSVGTAAACFVYAAKTQTQAAADDILWRIGHESAAPAFSERLVPFPPEDFRQGYLDSLSGVLSSCRNPLGREPRMPRCVRRPSRPRSGRASADERASLSVDRTGTSSALGMGPPQSGEQASRPASADARQSPKAGAAPQAGLPVVSCLSRKRQHRAAVAGDEAFILAAEAKEIYAIESAAADLLARGPRGTLSGSGTHSWDMGPQVSAAQEGGVDQVEILAIALQDHPDQTGLLCPPVTPFQSVAVEPSLSNISNNSTNMFGAWASEGMDRGKPPEARGVVEPATVRFRSSFQDADADIEGEAPPSNTPSRPASPQDLGGPTKMLTGKKEVWAQLAEERREQWRQRQRLLRGMKRMPFEDWYRERYNPDGTDRDGDVEEACKMASFRSVNSATTSDLVLENPLVMLRHTFIQRRCALKARGSRGSLLQRAEPVAAPAVRKTLSGGASKDKSPSRETPSPTRAPAKSSERGSRHPEKQPDKQSEKQSQRQSAISATSRSDGSRAAIFKHLVVDR